jgi:esterase/lipase superfamily enzyme
VIEALESLEPLKGPSGWPRFDNLVFAAPDVKTPIFSEQGLRVSHLADRATLYASSTDWALWASEKFNQGPRAGYTGSNGVFVETGLESIDASDLDDRWQPWLIRHSYVFDRPKGVADLQELIVGDLSAEQRNLQQKQKEGLPYWSCALQFDETPPCA